MLKKTVKYTDYDGNEREEDFYFNLTKAEVLEMQLSKDGGLEKTIRKIIAAQDKAELIKLFKEIVLKAYGEKSADGRRFVKSEEISTAFTQTEAYSNLFIELISNEAAAVAFINGIIPQDLQQAPEGAK